MNNRQVLVALYCIFISVFSSLNSQSNPGQIHFCGELPIHQAISINPDSILYDRFGNTYDIVESSNTGSAVSTVFLDTDKFLFKLSDDVPSEYHDVIIAVGEYIESEITSDTSPFGCGESPIESKVEILIDEIELDIGVLASASPFFYNHSDREDCVELRINLAREKYITGFTSENNTIEFDGAVAESYDGVISIASNIDFYTELTPDNIPGTDTYDFYTVFLHEMLHILGFASATIGNNDFVSIWDTKLEFESGNVTSPLVSNNCVQSCYSVSTNTESELVDYLNEICQTTIIPRLFAPGGVTPIFPDFSQFIINQANFYSHIGSDCDDMNTDSYVMFPFLMPEEVNRLLTNDENLILCTLGYNTSSCSGECYVFPNSEDLVNIFVPDLSSENENLCCAKTYSVCIGEELEIPFLDLLCNDLSTEDVSVTEVFIDPEFDMIANVSMSNASVILNVSNQHNPLGNSSSQSFRVYYTMKSCGCTLVDSYVDVRIAICDSCDETDDDCVNLSCVNEFENLEYGYHNGVGIDDLFFNFDNSIENSPDIILDEINNNKFILLGASDDEPKLYEGFAVKLLKPIQKGCKIDYEFKAFSLNDNLASAFFQGCSLPPCDPHIALFPSFENCDQSYNCNGNTDFVNCLFEVPIDGFFPSSAPPIINNSEFFEYFGRETYEGENDLNYIIVSAKGAISIFVDDLQITQDCSCADFEVTSIDCNSYAFESLEIDGTFHTWDFGDDNSSSEASPFHEYSENGTYEVTHTVTDDCTNMSTSTETIVVNCLPPLTCIPEENTIVFNGMNSNEDQFSELIALGQFSIGEVIEGRDIIINGDFTIDEEVTFRNCSFLCESGAEIIIKSDEYVNITGSTLAGCEKMWKGITVDEGKGFFFSRNTIMDAEHAITLLDKSNFISRINIYDRNYIGIYSPPSESVKENLGMPIVLSKFICTENLLPAHDDQEHWSDRTFSGIFVNDLNHLMVIEGTQPPLQEMEGNEFKDIKNGILAVNTNIVAEGNDFINMSEITSQFNNTFPYLSSGNGVGLEEVSFSQILKNNFIDCPYGVTNRKVEGFSTEINRNTFRRINPNLNFRYNIFIRDCHTGSINVDRNVNYNTRNNKFNINTCTSISSFSMTFNTFNDTGNSFIDPEILIQEVLLSNGVRGEISNNTINKTTSDSAPLSIRLVLTPSIDLENNNISISRPNELGSEVIVLLSCPFTRLNSNRISYSTGSGSAFYASASPVSSYCCNTADNADHGFHFFDNNDFSFFSTNSMRNNKTGLLLSNSIIGPQSNMGNLWIGTITEAELLDLSVDQDLPFKSQFTVGVSPNTLIPTEISPNDISSLWFVIDPGLNSPTCQTIDCENLLSIINYDVDQTNQGNNSDPCDPYIDLINALSNINYDGSFELQFEWLLRFYLFQLLSNLPTDDWKNCSEINDFYLNDTNVKKYSEVNDRIKDLYKLNSTDNILFKTDIINLKFKLDYLKTLSISIDNEESYLQNALEVNNTLSFITESSLKIKEWNSHLNGISDLRYDQTISLINNLDEDLFFLGKLKETWRIKSLLIKNGSLSLSIFDKNILTDISKLCPLEYGLAVYESIALLDEVDSHLKFGDKCQNIERREIISSTFKENKFSIYPNPAINLLYVKNENIDSSYDIEIYDITGKLIYQENDLIMQTEKIPLDLLSEGLYFIQILQNGTLQERKKFFVIR